MFVFVPPPCTYAYDFVRDVAKKFLPHRAATPDTTAVDTCAYVVVHELRKSMRITDCVETEPVSWFTRCASKIAGANGDVGDVETTMQAIDIEVEVPTLLIQLSKFWHGELVSGGGNGGTGGFGAGGGGGDAVTHLDGHVDRSSAPGAGHATPHRTDATLNPIGAQCIVVPNL